MATITTILATDIIAASRVTINTNFSNLNTDKVDVNSTYADPAWITSLAGSKITGNIGGNAATATALATARTIAGVSFNGTANISIPSTGLSDSSDIVRGAASVASGGILYGTGAGQAGSEAAFLYNAATNAATIGSARIGDTIHYSGYAAWGHDSQHTLGGLALIQGSAGDTYLNSASGAALVFRTGAVESFRVAPTTRNLLLGTTTDDGTNRLQVNGNLIVNGGNALRLQNAAGNQFASMLLNANSIVTVNYPFSVGPSSALTSAVTFGVHDGTPTTGSTSLVVRAGAGQGSNNLTTWQNSGGTAMASVRGSDGALFAPILSTFDTQTAGISTSTAGHANGVNLNSSALTAWSSTSSWFGTKDLSLSRASANTLQVGDGGANANGKIAANIGLLGGATDDGVNKLQVAGSVTVGGATSSNSISVTRTGANPASLQLGAFADKPTVIFNGTAGLAFETFTTTLMNLSTAGTLTLRNETPTTGSTSLVVRAGAGQGSNNLTTWQNSGGTQVAAVTSAGDIYSLTLATTGNQAALTTNGIEVRSAAVAAWSSTTSWAGTKDLSLSRAGVNIGQFGDGGSNSNGLLYLKGVRPVGSTVANLPAAAGNTGMMATVTDANATTIGTTVAGGGANTVLVWSNGTNWRIYAN